MQPARILVAEDEPLVALELTETLREAGYDVLDPIDSADLVVGRVRETKPDLVVMDVRLRSFIDGVDAVTRLRFLSSVPVIYLTAYSTPDMRQRAETTRPAAFLMKPVDGPVLVAAIERALNQRPTGA